MIKLFHGNNEFDLHEDIKVIKTDLFSADLSDPNTTVFQAPDIKFPHLESIVSTVPFMADYRFVMVEGLLSSVEAQKGGSSTALLELENILKACPPTTYLIFTENIKLRSTGRLLKAKSIIKTDSAVIEILQDEKGISPGQACVFYYKDNFGERVLGGGWIDKTVNENLSTQLTEH